MAASLFFHAMRPSNALTSTMAIRAELAGWVRFPFIVQTAWFGPYTRLEARGLGCLPHSFWATASSAELFHPTIMLTYSLKPYKPIYSLILPLVRPDWAANRPLKHHKPHYSLRKTEVNPRSGFGVALPWGLQTHLWCSKNSSFPWTGSNLAPLGSDYGDKMQSSPICDRPG